MRTAENPSTQSLNGQKMKNGRANGFEASTSWSRTSLDQTKSVELTAFACAFPPLIRATWATKYRWPQSRPTCLGALLPGIFPQIACPSYLISEVKRFHRHLATVTFERFLQVRRILAGVDSALRTGHDPPIDFTGKGAGHGRDAG